MVTVKVVIEEKESLVETAGFMGLELDNKNVLPLKIRKRAIENEAGKLLRPAMDDLRNWRLYREGGGLAHDLSGSARRASVNSSAVRAMM